MADVLVVGAGPAGLFAALGVLSGSSKSVLVIDAGRDVESRRTTDSGLATSEDLVQGVGGAGLFSDGKLCLSLGVGGELPVGVSESARARLLEGVRAVFGIRAPELAVAPDKPATRAAALDHLGLEFGYYPVVHIGTDHCQRHIVHLRDRVHALGGSVHSESSLKDLERQPSGVYSATVVSAEGPRTINARNVVLALGKVGSQLENQLCLDLGATSVPLPMYIGVRVETDKRRAAPLFDGVADPKYKLHFSDGTKIKTHCAAEGGEVLALRYDGLPLAGGHAFRDRPSNRSSFAVLWNGIRGRSDARRYATHTMQRAASLTGGKLLVQRWHDYRQSQLSTEEALCRARLSAQDYASGDLRSVLPAEYFQRFDAFFAALCGLAPALAGPKTVLFAPAIEWWSARVATNEHLETEVPGLYVAGDGAGWSQGIVHAAATGLLVAEGITGRPLDASVLARGRPEPPQSSVA